MSTINKSPQHPLSLVQPAVSSSAVSWQRLIVVEITRSGSVFTASRAELNCQPNCSAISSQSFFAKFNWLIAPAVLVITSRHEPNRKHHSSVVACVVVAAGMCLPNCCPETGCITLFIKNSLPQQRTSYRDRYLATSLHATLYIYMIYLVI
jgi:hypothetical protein